MFVKYLTSILLFLKLDYLNWIECALYFPSLFRISWQLPGKKGSGSVGWMIQAKTPDLHLARNSQTQEGTLERISKRLQRDTTVEEGLPGARVTPDVHQIHR